MRRLENGSIQGSWSSVQKFMSCQRKSELEYFSGLKPIEKDSIYLMVGKAFHEGMRVVLVNLYAGLTLEAAIDDATLAIHCYIDSLTEQNIMRHNYETGEEERDVDYYALREDARKTTSDMLAYYVPQLELGTRYMPVQDKNGKLMVEYELNHEMDNGVFTGYVDAVMYDTQEKKWVVFDWKTRKGISQQRKVLIDGQLHAYASILTDMGLIIDEIIQVEFVRKLPTPAKVNKDGKPSITAQKTTWDTWYASLPEPTRMLVDNDLPKWQEWASNKLHNDSSFLSSVSDVVSRWSAETTLNNLENVLMQMDNAQSWLEEDEHNALPATYNTYVCYATIPCPFAEMCSSVFRHGGSLDELIETKFK